MQYFDFTSFFLKHHFFRIDWDKHKITADHMYKLEQDATENNVIIPKQVQEYYEPFDVKNAFKTKIPKDDRKVEDNTKNTLEEDDSFEIDRIQESAKLTLKKIGTYEIPAFNETKMIGILYIFTFITFAFLVELSTDLKLLILLLLFWRNFCGEFFGCLLGKARMCLIIANNALLSKSSNDFDFFINL